MGRAVLLATANQHKLEELRRMLADTNASVLSIRDAGISELPEETGETFEANALLKARHCASLSGKLAVADDSGLMVDALGGFPGVNSNRWAGPDTADADRNRLLLERMRDVPDDRRGARFVCMIAVALPDGTERTFMGALEGEITREPRGGFGFGYDPIFYVPELERTVGELPPEEKNRISHRARALEATRPWLLARLHELT